MPRIVITWTFSVQTILVLELIGSLITIFAGGVGVGGALIYFGAKSSADAIEAGVGIAILGTIYGFRFMSKSADYAESEIKKDLDDSDVYRYVRFLPEYAWVDWSTKEQKGDMLFYRSKEKKQPQTQVEIVGEEINGVFIGFYPDAN